MMMAEREGRQDLLPLFGLDAAAAASPSSATPRCAASSSASPRCAPPDTAPRPVVTAAPAAVLGRASPATTGTAGRLPPMGHEWDAHTAVEATPDGWSADLDPGWAVGGGVNGGYLLGVIGRAIGETVPDKPDPLAVSAYYLSATRPGRPRSAPASCVTAAAPRRWRPSSARATTPASPPWRRTATCRALPDDVRTTAVEPELPPREECFPTSRPGGLARTPPLMDRFDMRFDPACVGWAVGEPSGRGLLQGWFRLADGRDPDPVQLLMVFDALPPVTLDLGHDGLGADPRADGPRARRARARLAEGLPPHAQRRRRDVRGGLRGLGLRRPARRAEPPARTLPASGLTGRPLERVRAADGAQPPICRVQPAVLEGPGPDVGVAAEPVEGPLEAQQPEQLAVVVDDGQPPRLLLHA